MAKVFPLVARFLLGAMFCFTGLNGIFQFLPMPPPEGPAGALIMAFAASGYMLPLVFGAQLAGGLLVLSGRLTALGLLVLAPMLVHILAFHAFLEPKGSGAGIVLTLLAAYLAWVYRASFAGLFAGAPATAQQPRETAIPAPRLSPSAG